MLSQTFLLIRRTVSAIQAFLQAYCPTNTADLRTRRRLIPLSLSRFRATRHRLARGVLVGGATEWRPVPFRHRQRPRFRWPGTSFWL